MVAWGSKNSVLLTNTFFLAKLTIQYKIDGTDIARSIAAVGRNFRFPLDVELPPTLNSSINSELFQYLRDASTDSTSALSILQVLIDDRRSSHRLRQNEGKLACALKVGDVVETHVQVQLNASQGIVGKLSYRARRPFIITQDLGGGLFEVQRYGDGTATTRKYKNTELYLYHPCHSC